MNMQDTFQTSLNVKYVRFVLKYMRKLNPITV